MNASLMWSWKHCPLVWTQKLKALSNPQTANLRLAVLGFDLYENSLWKHPRNAIAKTGNEVAERSIPGRRKQKAKVWGRVLYYVSSLASSLSHACFGCVVLWMSYFKISMWIFFSGMLMHASTFHTAEAKAGGLWVPGPSALLSEILSEKETL